MSVQRAMSGGELPARGPWFARRFVVALAVGAAVGGGCVLGFGPAVRGQARDIAERRGLDVNVSYSVPTLSGVRLRGVSVELREVKGLRVWCEEVFVPWGQRRPSRLSGVRVVSVGEPDALSAAVRRWREKFWLRAGAGAEESSVNSSDAFPRVDGVVVDWRGGASGSEDRLHVANAAVSVSEGSFEVRFDTLRGRYLGVALEVDGGSASGHAREGRWWVDMLEVSRFAIAELDLHSSTKGSGGERAPSGGVGAAAGASTSADSPAGEGSVRPDDSVGSSRTSETVVLPSRPVAAHSAGTSDEPGARLRALDLLVRQTAEVVSRHLGESPTVSLGAVTVRGHAFDQAVAVGPVSVSLSRGPAQLLLALESLNPAGTDAPANVAHRPLSLQVRVPADPAVAAPLRLEIAGGPITLAQLGLRDGDFGLSNVARAFLSSDASLELDAEGLRVRVEGSGTVRGLAVRHPRLAHDALEGLQIGWRGRFDARLDGTELTVKDAEFDLGQLKLLVSGSYRHRDDGRRATSSWQEASVSLDFEIPLVTCQSVFDSLPRALVPSLAGTTFAGSLSMKGHARFDGSELLKTYDVDWDGTQSCRILEVPDRLRIDRFRQPFEKVVYTPDGQEQKMTFGPGTPGWVPMSSITKHMETAVLLSEDGRFRRHHGFDQEAIINSLRENLLAGAFRRGASTISMQLAKNLFLTREKVLSRKLQEAVLTLYLEQELTKQEILELYFNVIEYGPLVYGIGPAAQYHFGTTPSDLSLAQAAYLGSILQNPKKQFYGADGEVIPARMEYLRKLMKMAAKLNLISPSDLETGLQERLFFGKPSASADGVRPSETSEEATDERLQAPLDRKDGPAL